MEETGDGAKASCQDARGGGAQAQGRHDVAWLWRDLEALLCLSYPICGPVHFEMLLIIYGSV